MASWHGHRDEENIPAQVREIWQNKFRPPDPRHFREQQSNVDLAVLDSTGRLVHSFDGFRHGNPGSRESLGEYTAREMEKATSRLELDDATFEERPLNLPDLEEGSSGVRVFVSLKDDRMTAYQAPIVEVVPLTGEDWKSLKYPEKERSVEAAALKKWLSQIYPSGVMERTDPRTKKVYRIESTEGTLSLAPAGRDERHRYATLTGNVTLTDEGADAFSYEGQLKLVLTYGNSGKRVQSLQGVFEGIYPRTDQMHQRTRNLPLEAAIESRPDPDGAVSRE